MWLECFRQRPSTRTPSTLGRGQWGRKGKGPSCSVGNCEWSRKANFGRRKLPPTLLVRGREHRPRDSQRFQYIVFINYKNKIITGVATGESFFFLLLNWLVDFVVTSWTAHSARNAYLYKSGKKAVYQFDFKMNVLHKSKMKCFYLDVVLFIRPWSKFMQASSVALSIWLEFQGISK